MAKKDEGRKFKAWYTHELLEMSLKDVQKRAEEFGIDLADPDNPTQAELQEVFKATFEEMSDPWEVTANGSCEVREVS